jgi:microcystin-dependent protein
MPTISSKTRQTIQARFVQNAIPTQADYADLINASLNQADDGIYKIPNEPLSIVGKTTTAPVLRFYGDATATTWAWQIQLSADNKAGFALVSGDNQTRFFFDTATGNVGIGTTSPTAKLQVAGTLGVTGGTSLAGLTAGVTALTTLTATGATSLAALTATGATNLAALTTTGNIIMSTDAFYLNNSSKNIGIGTATPLAKLHILEATGTAASTAAGSLLIEHNDSGGASSIVFRSKVDNNDFAYLEYKEKTSGTSQAGLLTLGILNDSDDHIALITNGNVGIGTTTPTSKLHVAGTLGVTAATNLAALTATGPTNLAALTATGTTSLAALATSGNIAMSTDTFYLDSTSKNIGIGTTSPSSKLQVAGTLAVTGATNIAALTATGATNLAAVTTSGNITMSSDAFYLNNSSKSIGIGTATPAAKLHILEATGTAASAGSGSLLIDHNDSGGTSSLVFRSKGNSGSDYAYLEYKERNPDIVNNTESGLLTLGIQNDTDDHIALLPSGNVGIGTKTPGAKLHVAGALKATESTDLGGQVNILTLSNPIRFSSTWTGFPDSITNGSEICNDTTSHKTLMIIGNRSAGNPRSVSIWDVLNVKGNLNVDGNVGIGTGSPTAKLQVIGGSSIDTLTVTSTTGNNGLTVSGATSLNTLTATGATRLAALTASGATSLAALATSGNIAMSTDAFYLDSASKNIGIGTTSPNAKLQVAGSIYARGISGPINDYTKAHYTLSGGGTIRWTKGGQFRWSNRFICICMGRTSIVPAGHINIRYPINASQLTVWDGSTDRLTSDGIQLRAWEALYAIHNMDLDENQVTYRVIRYECLPTFEVPINWILVAVMNDDDKSLKLGTGITIAPGASVTHGCPLPCGTIMMWSGQAADIPTGWAVCDGTNGTPDLRGRFILGSGQGAGLTSRIINNSGGRETITLTTTEMPSHSHTITDPGHSHTWTASRQLQGIDDSNYSSELSKGDKSTADTMSKTTTSATTGLSLGNTGSGGAFDIMPPFFVLIYIMKSF